MTNFSGGCFSFLSLYVSTPSCVLLPHSHSASPERTFICILLIPPPIPLSLSLSLAHTHDSSIPPLPPCSFVRSLPCSPQSCNPYYPFSPLHLRGESSFESERGAILRARVNQSEVCRMTAADGSSSLLRSGLSADKLLEEELEKRLKVRGRLRSRYS